MRTSRLLLLVAFGALVAPLAAHAATPLVITPASGPLANATVGAVYGQALTTLGGGTRPVTWTISAGALPKGLSIIKNWNNSSTMITGTPTTAGTANFTIQAKDKSGNTASGTYSITVSPPPPLAFDNPIPPDIGVVGTFYAANLFAVNGTKPYVFSIAAGTLPPGTVLTGNQVLGTPTRAGTYAFTARVIDAKGAQATKDFIITILPA